MKRGMGGGGHESQGTVYHNRVDVIWLTIPFCGRKKRGQDIFTSGSPPRPNLSTTINMYTRRENYTYTPIHLTRAIYTKFCLRTAYQHGNFFLFFILKIISPFFRNLSRDERCCLQVFQALRLRCQCLVQVNASRLVNQLMLRTFLSQQH